MTQWLAVFECASIQTYMFASPRLAENLGASQLVHEALESDLTRVLGVSGQPWRDDPTRWMEIPAAPEFVYIGGGNALVRFPTREVLIDATRRWSSALLRKAPGLRLRVGSAQYQDGQFLRAKDEAFEDLEQSNPARVTAALECLPVTRRCASTGLAASNFHGLDNSWISEMSSRQRAANDAGRRRLTEDVHPTPSRPYVAELDLLTLKGESGQVAVGHIDGNSMGAIIKAASEGAGTDAEAVENLRRCSIAITTTSRDALKETLAWLDESLTKGLDGVVHPDVFPVRPVVFGGDDLTFVANGRVGLAFAARYLRAWSRKNIEGVALSACGGVAIVQAHFPFSRAYDLANELSRNAKLSAREMGGSWIDFHILTAGTLGDIAHIRSDRSRRPWRIDAPNGDVRSWTHMESMCRVFSGDTWPRWRLKQLRDAFELEAREQTDVLLSEWKAKGLTLPDIWALQPDPSSVLDGIEAVEYLPAELHDQIVASGTLR